MKKNSANSSRRPGDLYQMHYKESCAMEMCSKKRIDLGGFTPRRAFNGLAGRRGGPPRRLIHESSYLN